MQAFALGTSGSLGLVGLLSLLKSFFSPHNVSDLVLLIIRAYAFGLITLAVLVLLFTDILPTRGVPSSTDTDTIATNPYANPTLVVMTVYHAVMAMSSYSFILRERDLGTIVVFLSSVALACVGVWTLMFGQGEGKFSKTTGADKHTSNFPFSNATSSSAQKKEYKKSEKTRRRL